MISDDILITSDKNDALPLFIFSSQFRRGSIDLKRAKKTKGDEGLWRIECRNDEYNRWVSISDQKQGMTGNI